MGTFNETQRAIANKPGTEQRSGFGVGIKFRYRKAEVGVGNGVFSVSAIKVITGKMCVIA